GGEPAENEERASARERASAGVEEELGPVAPVEVGPAAGEVTAKRLGRLAADRHDSLLVSLPGAADEPLVEGDAAPLERAGLRHSRASRPRALVDPRRRGARRGRGRGGRAAALPGPLRRAARPRRRRGFEAAWGGAWGGRGRPRDCRCASREAADGERSCGP